MALLSLGFQVAAIIMLLWGATLLVGLMIPRLSVALPLAPWVMLTGLFGLETVVGLGSLRGMATLGMGSTAFLAWLSAQDETMGSAPGWLSAWRWP